MKHFDLHKNKHHTIFSDGVKTFLKDIKNMDLDETEATAQWNLRNGEWQALPDDFECKPILGLIESYRLILEPTH